MTARTLLALLLIPMLSSADSKEKAAMQAMNQGVALYQRDLLAEAHDLFVKARTLAPTRANPYRWLAVTEQRMGDCRSAIANVEAFLQLIPAGDPRAVEAGTIRDACKAKLDAEAEAAAETKVAEARPTPAPAVERDGTLAPVLDGATTPTDRPSAPPAAPLYRRWWLWTAVGAVVAVGLGVGLGVGLSSAGPTAPATEGGDHKVSW